MTHRISAKPEKIAFVTNKCGMFTGFVVNTMRAASRMPSATVGMSLLCALAGALIALPSMAAITHVQDLGTGSTLAGGETSFTIDVPAVVAVNHTILVEVAAGNQNNLGATLTDTRGNTYSSVFGSITGIGFDQAAFLATVTTALQPGDKITVTFGGTRDAVATASEFAGMTSVPDHINGSSNSNGSSFNTGTITTTQPNELIVGYAALAGSSSSVTQSGVPALTPMSVVASANGLTIYPGYAIVAALGTYNFAGNLGASEQVIATILSFAPAPTPPVGLSAVSRKVHGGAGTFDLPLSAVTTNPTTEPRTGPTHTIVFTFDKAINAANATITEGVATADAPIFSGNDVIVGITGVSNQQYVTITLTNVASTDGGTGGSGSVRVGFLLGDVSQNRVVTVADLGLVNAQLAQIVTTANYLKDVNASGTLTVADKGITNANLTKALPAP